MRIDEVEDYCELVLKSSNPIEIESTFKILLTYYKCSSIRLSRESTFWRARNLEGRALFNNIADLSYPPKNLTKSGRMNKANEPIFYLSTRKETALAEIGIKEMDFVQVAGFRIAHGKELAVSIIGMFWNVFKNGGVPLILKDPNQQIFNYLKYLMANYHEDIPLILIYIDKFFATILSAVDASESDYLHTKILSRLIMDKSKSVAIAYPSIKDEGAYNLAVKSDVSDTLLENVSCFVLRIDRKKKYGIFLSEIESMAENIDNLGDFVWTDMNNIKYPLNGFHNIFYNQKGKEDEEMNNKHILKNNKF